MSYYVKRDGGAPAGNCPSGSSSSTATSCTDGGLAVGTYSYTVTAVWRSWAATSAPASANVTSGAATHLALTAASVVALTGLTTAWLHLKRLSALWTTAYGAALIVGAANIFAYIQQAG